MPSIPFTPPAYAQLQTEQDRLAQERQAVIVRLQAARELGDLSENGAYKYAKQELGSISRQLRHIRHLLKEAVVVQPTTHTIVEFGATVQLTGPRGSARYLIVSEHESNPAQHKLSTHSPIGAAILGKQVGDSVQVTTPAGTARYVIEAIA